MNSLKRAHMTLIHRSDIVPDPHQPYDAPSLRPCRIWSVWAYVPGLQRGAHGLGGVRRSDWWRVAARLDRLAYVWADLAASDL